MNPGVDLATTTKLRRYSVTWIVVAAIVFCALLAVWSDSDSSFDSAIWQSASGNDPIRLQMVDDLMRKHHLVSMGRNEIDKMLGVPTKTDYFSDFDYVYWLGPERGYISIDSEWLCLKFIDDIVVDAQMMRD